MTGRVKFLRTLEKWEGSRVYRVLVGAVEIGEIHRDCSDWWEFQFAGDFGVKDRQWLSSGSFAKLAGRKTHIVESIDAGTDHMDAGSPDYDVATRFYEWLAERAAESVPSERIEEIYRRNVNTAVDVLLARGMTQGEIACACFPDHTPGTARKELAREMGEETQSGKSSYGVRFANLQGLAIGLELDSAAELLEG